VREYCVLVRQLIKAVFVAGLLKALCETGKTKGPLTAFQLHGSKGLNALRQLTPQFTTQDVFQARFLMQNRLKEKALALVG